LKRFDGRPSVGGRPETWAPFPSKSGSMDEVFRVEYLAMNETVISHSRVKGQDFVGEIMSLMT